MDFSEKAEKGYSRVSLVLKCSLLSEFRLKSDESMVSTCWLMTSSLCSFRWVLSHSVARDDGSTKNGLMVLWKNWKIFIS